VLLVPSWFKNTTGYSPVQKRWRLLVTVAAVVGGIAWCIAGIGGPDGYFFAGMGFTILSLAGMAGETIVGRRSRRSQVGLSSVDPDIPR
jgi:hypothetical protein